MEEREGLASPLFGEIWEETLVRLKDSDLFGRTILDELKSLAEHGELKNEKKVLGAIQPKQGGRDEDNRA